MLYIFGNKGSCEDTQKEHFVQWAWTSKIMLIKIETIYVALQA